MASSQAKRSLAYPSWHPVIHHSLVLFFIVMVVLLPVLYIRTRHVPYWVIPLVLSSCTVVYLVYWVWVCVYCRHVDDSDADQRVTIATNASSTTSGCNSSTVGIPPRSFMINQRNRSSSPTTAVLYLQQHHSASVRSYSTEYNIDAPPPPAYHTSFEHTVVDLSLQSPSPPSYHSVKDEEDSNNNLLSTTAPTTEQPSPTRNR